ncbi:MAG: hypothetical protein EBR82_47405 [Caulobacteraceae bacterium]|nr:hypothetical protein [Caulobacteraceae bacterium]
MLATLNLLAADGLAVWGAMELAGGESALSRALVGVMMACAGLLMLKLLHVAASHAVQAVRIAAASAAALVLLTIAGDLYLFLLSRANGAVERATAQSATVQSAAADASSLQSELATWQATLSRELATGPGPKAQAAQARVDALRARVDALRSQAHTAETAHQHRAPLLVACERFGWSEDVALKCVLGVVVLVGLVPAYIMLLAAGTIPLPQADGPEPEPAPEPAPVARRTSAPPATLLPNIVWRPAPDWLDEARLNQQRRCQPSELAIKLGTRTKMIG